MRTVGDAAPYDHDDGNRRERIHAFRGADIAVFGRQGLLLSGKIWEIVRIYTKKTKNTLVFSEGWSIIKLRFYPQRFFIT